MQYNMMKISRMDGFATISSEGCLSIWNDEWKLQVAIGYWLQKWLVTGLELFRNKPVSFIRRV